jgi:hypothetical protein
VIENDSELKHVLICNVLTGKSKVIEDNSCLGKNCEKNVCGGKSDHDSHISKLGKEHVVFSDDQVLPVFHIFYKNKKKPDNFFNEYE